MALKLLTPNQVISAFGGTFKVADALQITPGAISHWKREGIPSDYFLMFVDGAARRGLTISPTAFKFKGVLWPSSEEAA